jgi:hypothetical protein
VTCTAQRLAVAHVRRRSAVFELNDVVGEEAHAFTPASLPLASTVRTVDARLAPGSMLGRRMVRVGGLGQRRNDGAHRCEPRPEHGQ